MDLQLIKATSADAEIMLRLQRKCFAKHFERYHDVSSSPYNETLGKMLFRINYEKGSYYKIVSNNILVGCIWVFEKEPEIFRVGIVYILPKYQSKGIGQKTLTMAENLHNVAKLWEIDCPEDLSINRRCYEKVGYKLTGEKEVINEKLTLVYYKKETTL
jgi:GNAT superfamily N-acetyltransferase